MAPCDAQARIRELEARVRELEAHRSNHQRCYGDTESTYAELINPRDEQIKIMREALESIAYPVGGGATFHDALVDAFDRIVGIARAALSASQQHTAGSGDGAQP